MILLFSTEDDDILFFKIQLCQESGEVYDDSNDMGITELNVNNLLNSGISCNEALE